MPQKFTNVLSSKFRTKKRKIKNERIKEIVEGNPVGVEKQLPKTFRKGLKGLSKKYQMPPKEIHKKFAESMSKVNA